MTSPPADATRQTAAGPTPMGHAGRAAFIALPAAALAATAWLLANFDLPQSASFPWVPALGVELAFRIDGLSALMLVMITGIGTAVFVYAGAYLAGSPGQARLYGLLTLFMLAMIGCVTADNLVVLLVFWELTSLTSFLLVGFKHEQEGSRTAAQQALLVTAAGGLALLASVVLLGEIAGTYSISELQQRAPQLAHTPVLTLALLLLLVGCFTKSAQFPFHFWLPNAMAAPTPVSAYLHSATMVKLGVYLLARLDPAFGDWYLWEWGLKAAGSITAAWAMVLALRERDLKRILAWSTVATLGTLVMLIGIRGQGATIAAGALLLAHGLYKAPLFFVAGNVDKRTGTRVIDHLGNLRRAMPLSAAAALFAGMSMAGLPLSFGFVVKDAIAGAKASADVFFFATAAYTVFGAIAVAVAGVVAIRVFWRPPTGTPAVPSEKKIGLVLVLPPFVLSLVGILLGLFPSFVGDLIASASAAMRPGAGPVGPILEPSLEPSLGSVARSVGLGALVYVFWDRLHDLQEYVANRIRPMGMARLYERLLKSIPVIAARVTRAMQTGRLPGYVALIVGAVTVALAVSMLAASDWFEPPDADDTPLGFAGACAIVAAGALLATVLRDRLVLLLAVGLVGYGSALVFLFAAAPDLALTQFVVETVFVIVLASVLLELKRQGRGRSLDEPAFRPGAALLALGFSAVLTTLMLAATAGSHGGELARFFGERAVTEAYGRNVVNVVLVDFRALDTLGEITVVLLSLLAARPLLVQLRRRARKREAAS